MTGNISLLVAFGAGLLSFLSPCVLPLVPVYLASLCGTGLSDDRTGRNRITLLLHSISFVVGFSIIFVALGAIAGLTGYAINLSSALLNKIAGGLLIALGIFMLVALRIPWLNFEKRLAPSLGNTTGYLRSFIIGAVFCLGWTPCVAPVLGGVLALASVEASAWQGACLLAVYSLGLGLPFLIIGAAFDSLSPLLRRIHRYSGLVYIISGLLLIIVGILVLTNNLGWFSSLTA
ncbi:Thiol:disulfide interchange protein DsbD [subsurface metagenome]